MQKNKHEPNNAKFEIRPASSEEAGLFYALQPEQDETLGAIGHVRMDFGRSGSEFWHIVRNVIEVAAVLRGGLCDCSLGTAPV